MTHPKVIDVLGTEITEGAIVAVNSASGAMRRLRVGRIHKISKTGKTIQVENISTATVIATDIDPRPFYKEGTWNFRVVAGPGFRINDKWYPAYDTIMVLETEDKTWAKIAQLIENFDEAR